jgi:uncharacterized RDD family membrane protein YckC
MDWFYVENQSRFGPVNEAEFARLVGAGTIRRETLVWRAGMKEWQPYGALLPTPPAPPASPEGTTFSAPSATMSAVRPVTTLRYAGFWIRFLARIVDGLIIGLVNFVVTMPLGIASFGFLTGTPDLSDIASMVGMILLATTIKVAIAGVYEITLTTMKGATLGKMALGLKVVRPDGSGISAGRSAGRFFGTWLSGVILCIGYIIAGFDDEKRSLHDRLCDTRVIRT